MDKPWRRIKGCIPFKNFNNSCSNSYSFKYNNVKNKLYKFTDICVMKLKFRPLSAGSAVLTTTRQISADLHHYQQLKPMGMMGGS